MNAYQEGMQDYKNGVVYCPYEYEIPRREWISGWSRAYHSDKDYDNRRRMWDMWAATGQNFGV